MQHLYFADSTIEVRFLPGVVLLRGLRIHAQRGVQYTCPLGDRHMG